MNATQTYTQHITAHMRFTQPFTHTCSTRITYRHLMHTQCVCGSISAYMHASVHVPVTNVHACNLQTDMHTCMHAPTPYTTRPHPTTRHITLHARLHTCMHGSTPATICGLHANPHACITACVHTCWHACTHVHEFMMHMHAYRDHMRTCLTCMHGWMQAPRVYTYLHTPTCANIPLHMIQTHICTHVRGHCMHTCMQACMQCMHYIDDALACTHMHTQLQTYVQHTQRHTHT